MIRAPNGLDRDLVAPLPRRRAHASFAFALTPGRRTVHALVAAGDEPLPALRPGGLTNWLDTKDQLKRDAHPLGLSARRFYLAPASGLSTGQHLLGRDVGAAPIVGSVRLGPDNRGAARAFHRGDIIVLTLAPQPQTAARALDQLLARLARQRLTPVSFSELVASSR